MTQPIHTKQTLAQVKLPQLKIIAGSLGVTPAGRKTERETWIDAIIAYQSSQMQKVADVVPEIEFADIDGFYNFEARVNNSIIAQVFHDAFDEQNCWVVEVAGIELHRCSVWSEACDYVRQEYSKGTLPQHATTNTVVMSALSTREEKAATIEVLEQHGNEYVVHNCENDNYYLVRPNEPDSHQRCECADYNYRGVKCKHQYAVENFVNTQRLENLLSTSARQHCDGITVHNGENGYEYLVLVEGLEIHQNIASFSSINSIPQINLESLLDKPFEELTAAEWRLLKEYESQENEELVAA